MTLFEIVSTFASECNACRLSFATFKAIELVKVVNAFASSLIASDSSPSVSKFESASPTKSFIAVVTKAVVASCVLFTLEAAVGAVGVPVKSGSAKSALRSSAVCNPSTLPIMWLCESSTTAAVRVALPKLVIVTLPVKSPARVITGSATSNSSYQ